MTGSSPRGLGSEPVRRRKLWAAALLAGLAILLDASLTGLAAMILSHPRQPTRPGQTCDSGALLVALSGLTGLLVVTVAGAATLGALRASPAPAPPGTRRGADLGGVLAALRLALLVFAAVVLAGRDGTSDMLDVLIPVAIDLGLGTVAVLTAHGAVTRSD